MKTFLKAVMAIVSVIVLSMSVTSCVIHVSKDTTRIVAKKVIVKGEVNNLILQNGINVHYIIGDEVRIFVKAHESVIDRLNFSLNNGTLTVSMAPLEESENEMRILEGGYHGCDVYITTPSLEAVSVNGSGSFECNDILDMPDGQFSVLGSGDVRVLGVEGSVLTCNCTGSGDIHITSLRVDSVSCQVKGSGDINAKLLGVKKGDFACYGSGDIEMECVNCGEMNAYVQGSGDILLRGKVQKLNKKNEGSGNIEDSELQVD